MSYTKQTWADLPSTTTPIDADALDHIEDGIELVHDSFDAHAVDTTSVHGITNTSTLQTDVNQAVAGVENFVLFSENGTTVKVWSTGTSSYVPISGVAPSGTIGLTMFIDPAGGHDPASSTGGSGDAYSFWLHP